MLKIVPSDFSLRYVYLSLQVVYNASWFDWIDKEHLGFAAESYQGPQKLYALSFLVQQAPYFYPLKLIILVAKENKHKKQVLILIGVRDIQK